MTSLCLKTVAGKSSSSHHPCHGGPATYRILPASVFPAGARRSKIGSHPPRRCGAYGTCRQAFVACVSETLCAYECFIHQFLCDSTDDSVLLTRKDFVASHTTRSMLLGQKETSAVPRRRRRARLTGIDLRQIPSHRPGSWLPGCWRCSNFPGGLGDSHFFSSRAAHHLTCHRPFRRQCGQSYISTPPSGDDDTLLPSQSRRRGTARWKCAFRSPVS